MAYEPGGATGYPSFDKSEDLMFQPGGSIQDYIRNMMMQGNVGMAQPMGNAIRDFPQDPMYGRETPSDLRMSPTMREGITNEIDMGPDPYQGTPSDQYDPVQQGMSPQDFIRMQLAGDVVPMRTHPPSISDVNMRLRSPGVNARSQGMQSIEKLGNDPRTIDLLGVLNMMTGREPGR